MLWRSSFDPVSLLRIVPGQMMKSMLPLLMMRHRRIPRAKWRDCVTPAGKHWIEQVRLCNPSSGLFFTYHCRRIKIPDDLPPEKFLHSMIGYHLATENSLCGMAMTQGIQRKVVNIGLGMKQLIAEPRGVSVRAYVESFAHKVRRFL